ncbi:MAG: phosphotransferase family protein [Marmoricola sp.]
MTVSESGWQPDPCWQRMRSGPAGSGVWLAATPAGEVVVKRLPAPGRGDPTELSQPAHVGYWRREADVALEGMLTRTPGVRAPEARRVEEDEHGVTVWNVRVSPAGNNGLYLARALGRFAAGELVAQPWWCRDLLADRLRRVEAGGGWPTLARTTLADVADRLWQRRGVHLRRLGALPLVPSHGDPTADNLLGRDEDGVVAVDWASFGAGPVGADLGYLALSVREELDVLLTAYAEGLGAGGLRVCRDDVRFAATVMACYTALCRVEWALARAAAGPGALAGKYRHPTVAPYLRALQRLFPELERLL